MAIYLHLGAHKTATSSLQSLMISNWDTLVGQGVYPVPRRLTKTSGKRRKKGHVYSENTTTQYWRIIRRKNKQRPEKLEGIQKIRDDFNHARRGCPNILLSDEALLGVIPGSSGTLYPRTRRCIKLLRQIFADEDVRVIYYIRNQDSYLESCYLQHAHLGKVFTASEFLGGIDLESLHWARVADEIAAVVGPENLAIRQFETIRNGFVPFAENFFRLSCPPKLLKALKIPDVAVNPGFSGLAVEIAHAVAPLVDDKQWAHFRKLLQNKFNNSQYPRQVLFNDEQRARLMERYQSENRELAERFPGWVIP